MDLRLMLFPEISQLQTYKKGTITFKLITEMLNKALESDWAKPRRF